MTDKLQDKIDSVFKMAEAVLAYEIDQNLYLPVREELKDFQGEHSLGPRKEHFKITVEACLLTMRDEIKFLLSTEKKGNG